MYVEALSKLARHSQQQGSWGGCSDISAALLQVVDVYKEVHEQQMNILKAFYVDLLVPLETNLEKDTKVVQLEQKKFNAQHKQRSESHSKAAALSRKQRKKNKSSANDKDLKTLQRLEEEQSKLDAFREQSLRTALTQERRRYGFVLERQCSLAKHFLSMHTRGQALFQQRLPDWQAVARGREALPEELQRLFTTRLGPQSMWADDDGFCRREDGSMASALRKTRSMDASALDIRCLSDAPEDQHHRSAHDSSTLSRARSDLNLSSRAHSPTNADSASPVRPQSLAVSSAGRGWGSPLARALYAYLSSGENQLSFLEGDILALMGERNKGWQFGENLRTQTSGWFPLAYTELLIDDASMSPGARRHQDPLACEWRPPGSGGPGGGPHGPHGPQGGAAPPPVAPLPPPQLQSPRGPGGPGGPRGHPQLTGRGPPSGPPPLAPAPHTPTRTASGGPAPHGGPLGGLAGLGGVLRPPAGSTGVTVGASLHSSNDSGFSNEPPAAPEIDYSDDEPSRGGDSTPRANGSPSDSPRGSPRGSPGSEERALSNVKGWLLYKSALDLWDDVEARRGQDGQRVPPPPRPSAAERADRDRSSSMTLPSSAKMRGRPLVPPPAPPPPPVPEANGHAVVKRTKSLLKFRRDTAAAADGSVLEGMALWRHRSLVDVRADEDGDGGAESGQGGDSPASSPKTVNGSLVKMKLVKIDIGEERQPEMNGHSNGHANGHSNGHAPTGTNAARHGHANGHSKRLPPRPERRRRGVRVAWKSRPTPR
ncbi:hypothetical protein ONE63_007600 [Megalurothrips usitatus]|uniref:Brain-specific angiogenesis inhibitor 1-associated protein 2-like protein 1 n=1 Tax=Megalurothrips usitatus TaxID=439358 RepID=A0AAV7XSF0_9NEOP|nr:hypothetical protein ONE63_007600 [Megalurothrips usitatus]